ncbi:MAG: GatB/YqeY domain-containing protein [Pseudomonadota bacterium]
MLRARLNDDLKDAVKSKDKLAVSTLRLVLAALKDRDIAARAKGNCDGVDDQEILQLLQKMIKQRRESIAAYDQGGRSDLVERESGEIEVIERFLPKQMDEAEVGQAIEQTITELEAASIKDMGKVIAALKSQYPGRMDFSKASQLVKQRLA